MCSRDAWPGELAYRASLGLLGPSLPGAGSRESRTRALRACRRENGHQATIANFPADGQNDPQLLPCDIYLLDSMLARAAGDSHPGLRGRPGYAEEKLYFSWGEAPPFEGNRAAFARYGLKQSSIWETANKQEAQKSG